jgi:hypothetical protein
MPSARRFPPPWAVEETNSACFILKDRGGQGVLRLGLTYGGECR